MNRDESMNRKYILLYANCIYVIFTCHMMGNSFGRTVENNSVSYMEELHDDVLIEILIRLGDPKSLASCTLVCRRWATTLTKNSSSFWITKCKFDGVTIPKSFLTKGYAHRVDFRLIWLKRPYGRNLIKNDRGEEGPKHWVHIAEGGFDVDIGLSYSKSYKLQRVDLVAEGIEPWILDEIKPTITVSELYTAAHDRESEYKVTILLWNTDWHRIGEMFNDERILPQCSDGRWEKSSYKFIGYPDGVRYVEFYSDDTRFFGSKRAKASVIVDIE